MTFLQGITNRMDGTGSFRVESDSQVHRRIVTRGSWLLLDPPSESGFARRVQMREKEDAAQAPFPSVDLILLSGAIREGGYDPIYLDAQIRGWTWRKLNRHAAKLNASGMLSLVSSSRLDEELSHLRELKESMNGVPLYIVASLYFALDPSKCRRLLEDHSWVDGLILNTAENNLSALLASPHAVPRNIAVRRGEDIHVPQVEVIYGEGLRLPRPVHSIFKNHRYYFPQSKRTPVTCVQASFGCPFTCEFCLDNALYRKMRYRDVGDLVEELTEIDRLGFREVYFKDLTFGLNKRPTDELLEKLIEKRLRLRWLCTTRVDAVTPRQLGRMKEAGCYGIEFGVESGLMHRREWNGKRITDEQIQAIFSECRRLGIETTAFVMIGFEDETEREVRETIRFIESIRPDFASYNVVNALPGTTLERRARDEGFLLESSPDHRFAASNLKHKYLTSERLDSLRQEAVRSFYGRPSAALNRLLHLRSFFELRKLVRLGRVALG